MDGATQNMLPALREDLRLEPGAPSINGEPRWLIYDPVRHKYFEIPEAAFELLSVWQVGSVQTVRGLVLERCQRIVEDGEILDLVKFLETNGLTDRPPGGDSRAYLDLAKRSKQNLLMKGVHGYLFIRIPLFRPARFLKATVALVAPFYSRAMLWLTLLAGIAGLYLVSRQWDQFTHTFLHFFSMEGAVYYGVSLIFIKTLHELAHAYTATKYGVRVPTMGIALMVLFPVLYTDVTDAWKLKSRRQQLEIAGAGIVMELAIACFATLAWAILPVGPVKSIAFTLATSSWILSLAVNLNPLMRFDGYYLLADLWGISNLQSRSFAVGRWWLREALFRIGHPPPDRFAKDTRNLLVIFAFSVWLYRFFLFLGIALLVYHIFFKALGIVLFIIEIIYFIVWPILSELRSWWLLRDEIMTSRRALVSLSVVVAVICLSVVPWRGIVEVPAVLEAEQETSVFSAAAGRIGKVLVREGEPVRKGQLLLETESPDLNQMQWLVERKITLARERLRRVAGGAKELMNSAVLETELAALDEEARGYEREKGRLAIKSPADGFVRDMDGRLHAGRWLKKDAFVARVVDGNGARLSGVVSEDDVSRVAGGAKGTFIPDDPALAAVAVELMEVAVAGERELQNQYLASIHGGSIAVERQSDGKMKPVSGVHLVRFSTEAVAPDKVLRGIVHVQGEAQSLAAGVWRQIMRVVVREANL